MQALGRRLCKTWGKGTVVWVRSITNGALSRGVEIVEWDGGEGSADNLRDENIRRKDRKTPSWTVKRGKA